MRMVTLRRPRGGRPGPLRLALCCLVIVGWLVREDSALRQGGDGNTNNCSQKRVAIFDRRNYPLFLRCLLERNLNPSTRSLRAPVRIGIDTSRVSVISSGDCRNYGLSTYPYLC